MLRLKMIVGLFVTLINVTAQAEWTGKKSIIKIKQQRNGLHVVLDNFTDTSSIDCDTEIGFWMPSDSEGYSERVSFLLASFMANKKVDISYYECSGLYLELGSVALEQ